MRSRRLRRGVFAAGVVLCVFSGTALGTRATRVRVTAKAAIVIDNRTGDVLFSRRADLPLPPASTTKILTALIALRSGRWEDEVRVSRYASRMPSSKIGLHRGWGMKVEDLVYAALLNSANDASVALAEGLAGSVPDFARLMNATARYLGATRSHFVNPNGLPAKGHVSTARDLTTIFRHALHYPQFREILSVRKKTVRPMSGSHRLIRLRSKNRLLRARDMKVVGKTGYTRRAKRCFVGAASTKDREIVFAFLGSRDLWGDARRLIHYGLPRASRGPYAPTEAEWLEVLAPAPVAPAAKRQTERAAARPQTPRFRYEIQLASFRTRRRAQRLSRQVARQGYEAVIERVRSRKRPWYRVTVRGFSDRAAARKAARSLGKAQRVDPVIVAFRT